MPWFNVDDSFHSHAKAWDAPDCAVALWTRAGSWSAGTRDRGFVPSGILARFCGDPDTAVRFLLDRGLWERTKGGYRFHDWPDWNLTAEQLDAKRESSRERQRRFRAAHANSNGVSDASVTRDKRVSHSAQSNPIQSVVDVSDLAEVADAHATDVISAITTAIYDRTSRVVTPEWAGRIAGHILASAKDVRNPAAYCAQAIAAEPKPQARFLPAYPETPA